MVIHLAVDNDMNGTIAVAEGLITTRAESVDFKTAAGKTWKETEYNLIMYIVLRSRTDPSIRTRPRSMGIRASVIDGLETSAKLILETVQWLSVSRESIGELSLFAVILDVKMVKSDIVGTCTTRMAG